MGEEVNIRIRVVLADPQTRSYALSLMRRTLFSAFNPFQVSTRFVDFPEGDWIN